MTNITRRTALRGATAAFVAAGITSPSALPTVASEARCLPAALLDLMYEYHDAHIASRQAEEAWQDTRDETWKRVQAAYITVPAGDGRINWLGTRHRERYPEEARLEFERNSEIVLSDLTGAHKAAAKRRIARLRTKVDAGIARCDAIKAECGLEQAIDRDTAARHRAYRSKDSLMAYRPTMIEEVAAIVRCLYETAKVTECYYNYPAEQVAIMLNPDLAVAS